jgi:hypothetical protein
MSIQLTKPLVVPEYDNALIKVYILDPTTLATVPLDLYQVDLQGVLTALIPGRTAKPNACALNGNDLYIANSSRDSQCIFKVPSYLTQPEHATGQTFIFTLDGNDYVGMAFDLAGNLYAAEGDLLNNQVFKYTGTDKAFPGSAAAAVNNYATRADLGNAGAVSYFRQSRFRRRGASLGHRL